MLRLKYQTGFQGYLLNPSSDFPILSGKVIFSVLHLIFLFVLGIDFLEFPVYPD